MPAKSSKTTKTAKTVKKVGPKKSTNKAKKQSTRKTNEKEVNNTEVNAEPQVDAELPNKKTKKSAKEAVVDVEPSVNNTKKSAKKTTKKSTKVTKKSGTKSGTKSRTKVKTAEDKVKTAEGKVCRYFKIYDKVTGTTRGRFSGSKPKQAANKAFTSVIKYLVDNGEPIIDIEISFTIKECTRGSNGKTYDYVGTRVILENPMKVTINKDKEDEKIITYKYNNKVMKDKKSTVNPPVLTSS